MLLCRRASGVQNWYWSEGKRFGINVDADERGIIVKYQGRWISGEHERVWIVGDRFASGIKAGSVGLGRAKGKEKQEENCELKGRQATRSST